jgi:hypothetical protein
LSKATGIKCPAPQPEDPKSPLLLEMLVVAPYKAPEKKEKKKPGRTGLRNRDQPGAASEETHASSNQEEEHEAEGGGDSPLTGKRAASSDASEEVAPPAQKKPRRTQVISSDDSSDSNTESEDFERVPRRNLRVKPPPRR